jgi:hypothetical protein
MTSVAAEGGPGTVDAVLPVVLRQFLAVFGYDGWTGLDLGPAAVEANR